MTTGYALIENGRELQWWPDKPDCVVLPNGDRVHCPEEGELQEWQFVRSPRVTPDMVDAERSRRVTTLPFGGKVFQFCDAKGSEQAIACAGTMALAAIIGGAAAANFRWSDPQRDFVWIAVDNSTLPMDAQTCLAFAKAAAEWKAHHVYAARDIKNMSTIPADYAADSRWPVAS